MRGALQRAFFWLAYRLRRTPWDTGVSPPELVVVVEGPGRLPPGRALDLGCGTGTNSVYMARHGWRVVGVDYDGRAVARARAKAAAAGVEARFLRADVTRLAPGSLDPGFGLVLDLGCFHSLTGRGRREHARLSGALAAPGATMLIFGFRQPRRMAGVTDEEVARLFGPWFEVVRVLAGEGEGDPAWYTLRRR
ncbi:MAG: class I SAM-dependent methyltransferase [Candidatus Dormibacterales bacterium]